MLCLLLKNVKSKYSHHNPADASILLFLRCFDNLLLFLLYYNLYFAYFDICICNLWGERQGGGSGLLEGGVGSVPFGGWIFGFTTTNKPILVSPDNHWLFLPWTLGSHHIVSIIYLVNFMHILRMKINGTCWMCVPVLAWPINCCTTVVQYLIKYVFLYWYIYSIDLMIFFFLSIRFTNWFNKTSIFLDFSLVFVS